MSERLEWISALSVTAPPGARERALRDAEPLVRRIAKREGSRFDAPGDVDDVTNLVLFELHAKGLPVEVAAPGSRALLVAWLRTSIFRRFNRLQQQRERRERTAEGVAALGGATPGPREGGQPDDGPEPAEGLLVLAATAAGPGEAGDDVRLEELLALVQEGAEHAASTSRRKGRAETIRASVREILDLYFGRVGKLELLERLALSREALDQRHTRARQAAIEGLDGLLALGKVTPLRHRRAVALCAALVLVKRNRPKKG